MNALQTLRGGAKYLIKKIHRASGSVLENKWNRNPFGSDVRATREEYLNLYDKARTNTNFESERIERESGYAIDREWLENLALHTQVTKKVSDIAFEHGKLLYALLRRYLAETNHKHVTVLETGTARGFSALCMAKALTDAGVSGVVITLDVLPHHRRIYWNCIDDQDGKKTRAELLAPWAAETSRVVFIQGDTLDSLEHLGLGRVNFAFLDAQHTSDAVQAEFSFVASRQVSGDLVFFDDATPKMFPGVVEAVEHIERLGNYEIRRLGLSEQRGYAWGVKR